MGTWRERIMPGLCGGEYANRVAKKHFVDFSSNSGKADVELQKADVDLRLRQFALNGSVSPWVCKRVKTSCFDSGNAASRVILAIHRCTERSPTPFYHDGEVR